jgi:hypothetical protein
MVPLRLVNVLNEVFSSFDDLVEKHRLEKIKTIGDCYTVAAGVPRERADHALALVQLALDMRETTANRTFGDERLAFRIGDKSGRSRRRDRPQEVHLRSLGRDRQRSEPQGIARAGGAVVFTGEAHGCSSLTTIPTAKCSRSRAPPTIWSGDVQLRVHKAIGVKGAGAVDV